MTRFSDKTVLVTGAASGLGRAAAVRLAAEGARLALVDVNSAGLDVAEQAIRAAAPGAEILSIQADVAVEAQVAGYVEKTLTRYGAIDGFFNNAGIEDKPSLTEDLLCEDFERIISINLNGVLFGLKHVLKVMRRQASGRIVNTSSAMGIRALGNQSGYTASKHAIIGLTRNSALEYGRFGIGINAIAPGAILTPLVQASFAKIKPDDWETASREFVSNNPMRRLGTPEEVASLVAFLLSDESHFINATVIPIDGGQSAQY